MSLKGVIFLKILIFEFFRFFWILFDFYQFILIFKNAKKGFYLHRTRGADVACGTRTDATWHARPRGRAVQAHATLGWGGGDADAWQGHVSPRRRSGGATWQCERASR